MGKRGETFARRKNDAYDTPEHALLPLLPHVPASSIFIEPCAGEGALARLLYKRGHSPADLFDIKPRAERIFPASAGIGAFSNLAIRKQNAMTFRLSNWTPPSGRRVPTLFITNPPWTFDLLAPIILNLWWQLPTWMLLSADFAHNENASAFMPMCRKVVSVGRVRWMEGHAEDRGNAPYDNAAWYLFDAENRRPEFYGRR